MNEDLEAQLLDLEPNEPEPQWRFLSGGLLSHLVFPGKNKALCGTVTNSWKDWRGDVDTDAVLARRQCARCVRKEVELT